MKTSPKYITRLNPNEVFVFGSNLRGIHGAGGAGYARSKFGAITGRAYGLQGQSFAIPTKDERIQSLDIIRIGNFVDRFLSFAADNPDKDFLVTEIGCGLAGFSPEEIAPLFKHHTDNVFLPERFVKILTT